MSGCSKTDSTPVVVSVVRDFGMYDRCVRNNPNLDGCELVPVDNTVENKAVTVCYNAALEDVVSKGGEGRWIVFCHEDWEVRENLAEALDGLDRNFLYGAIGVQVERYGRADVMVVRGRVVQPFGKGDGMAMVQGRDRDGEVGTFDCQCLIVHSSLLSRCGLRFDEKLLFDMYVEDFCAMAAERYGIRSRILPVECVHWSRGRISANFRQSVRYVRDKYAEASGRYASIAGHLNCFGADAGKRIFKWKDDVLTRMRRFFYGIK